MKQKVRLLIAMLAVIAVFVLWKWNFGDSRIESRSPLVRVVAAAHDIPVGAVLTLSDFGTLDVFSNTLTGRAVLPNEYTNLVGKKTCVFLSKEQPILWSDMERPLNKSEN